MVAATDWRRCRSFLCAGNEGSIVCVVNVSKRELSREGPRNILESGEENGMKIMREDGKDNDK